MAKISGGSNSFLLRALLRAIVDEKAIPAEKIHGVTKRFTEYVNETDIAKRNPSEVLRHVGDVLGVICPLGIMSTKAEVPGEKLAERFEAEMGPAPSVVGLHTEVPLGDVVLSPEELALKPFFASEALKHPMMALHDPKDQEKLRVLYNGAGRLMERQGIPVSPPPAPVDLALDPADIDLLCEDVDASTPPSARSTLQAALEEVAERFSKNLRHPFIESLTHEKERYIVVGTATVRSTKREGVGRSANCTAKNYRRIKDADESVLVHVDGRPMCATRELENGVCFVWLLHHVKGLVVRFWLNESDNGQRRDNPKGTYRITLVDDEIGWRKAA